MHLHVSTRTRDFQTQKMSSITFQPDGTLCSYDPAPLIDSTRTNIVVEDCKRQIYQHYGANITKHGFINNFALRVPVELSTHKAQRFHVAETYPQFTFTLMIGMQSIESVNGDLSALLLSQERLREQRKLALSFASELFQLMRKKRFAELICNKIVSYVLIDQFDDTTLTNICAVAPIQLQETMCKRKAAWMVDYPIATGLEYVNGHDFVYQQAMGVLTGPITTTEQSLQLSYHQRFPPRLQPRNEIYGYYKNSMGCNFVQYVEMEWMPISTAPTNCVTFRVPECGFLRVLLSNAILVQNVGRDVSVEKIIVSWPNKVITSDAITVQFPQQQRNWYAVPFDTNVSAQDVLQSKKFGSACQDTSVNVSIHIANHGAHRTDQTPQQQQQQIARQFRCYLQYAKHYHVNGDGTAGVETGCVTMRS